MFDLTSRITYKNVPKWHQDIVNACGNIPIALVGNKADVKDRKVKNKQIVFHRGKDMKYYDISAKSNYQIERPFVALLRQLAKDPELCLVEEAALKPQEVLIEAARENQLRKEAQEAAEEPLPEDED